VYLPPLNVYSVTNEIADDSFCNKPGSYTRGLYDNPQFHAVINKCVEWFKKDYKKLGLDLGIPPVYAGQLAFCILEVSGKYLYLYMYESICVCAQLKCMY
jgi:hypothetical protein